MDPKITQLIDRYISGTLNPEEKSAFEAQLASSESLRNEVELQHNVMEAAKRASQRSEIKRTANRYRRNRLVRNVGLSSLITAFVATTILYFTNKSEEKQVAAKEMAPISQEVKSKLDDNQDFQNIPIQYFQIPEEGSVRLSKQGVLISVPENAFLKDGKPYKGNVILQYQEAIRGIDIIKSGLSTMTGNDLLETQGMFSVAGYTEKGEQLEFNPEVGVYIQSPVDDCKSGMELYDGKKLSDGSIDWVNPEPLNKIPVSVDMAELNFYPANFEDELDKAQWKENKKDRDSLYLSLEHTIDISQAFDEVGFSDQFERVDDRSEVKEITGRGVYLKRDKKMPITKVDDVIAWEFSTESLGPNSLEITATAILREGYFVYPAQIDGPERTRILITPSGKFNIGKTKDASPVATIHTKDGPKEVIQNTAVFKSIIEFDNESQVEFPFRYIFKVGNKDFDYPITYRKSSVTLGQSVERQQAVQDSLAAIRLSGPFILPSNVVSFWNPAFNNTILSTREFERRMKAIHETCDNDVLALYTDNLEESISTIDRQVIALGYDEFQEFALENVGKVDINNPHYKLLSAFYKKSVKVLKADAKRGVKTAEEQQKAWNNYIANEREEDRKLSARRNQNYVDDMINFNKKNLIRQLRNSNGFTIKSGSFGSFTARRNCDAIRGFAAAQGPESFPAELSEERTFIEVEPSGYNDFSINIPNSKKYEQLYMYVFPDKLNSYQRLYGEGGNFECQMNKKISYSIGIVGVTKNGYEYFQALDSKGGELGSVQLEKISESELDKRIQFMNRHRFGFSKDVSDELDWLKINRKNNEIQRDFDNMIEFRHLLKLKIFPCVSVDPNSIISTTAVAESPPEEDDSVRDFSDEFGLVPAEDE